MLCQKTKEISIIEDKLLALREDADNNKNSIASVKSDLEQVQSDTKDNKDNIKILKKISAEPEIQQIGYRYLYSRCSIDC